MNYLGTLLECADPVFLSNSKWGWCCWILRHFESEGPWEFGKSSVLFQSLRNSQGTSMSQALRSPGVVAFKKALSSLVSLKLILAIPVNIVRTSISGQNFGNPCPNLYPWVSFLGFSLDIIWLKKCFKNDSSIAFVLKLETRSPVFPPFSFDSRLTLNQWLFPELFHIYSIGLTSVGGPPPLTFPAF